MVEFLGAFELSMESMELGAPWSSRWSSRKIDTVTPIGQHVSKRPSTTRLAPTGLNLNKARMKRSTGYGVCSLQRNFDRHLFLLYIITVITTIWMELLMKLCESIRYKGSLV